LSNSQEGQRNAEQQLQKQGWRGDQPFDQANQQDQGIRWQQDDHAQQKEKGVAHR